MIDMFKKNHYMGELLKTFPAILEKYGNSASITIKEVVNYTNIWYKIYLNSDQDFKNLSKKHRIIFRRMNKHKFILNCPAFYEGLLPEYQDLFKKAIDLELKINPQIQDFHIILKGYRNIKEEVRIKRETGQGMTDEELDSYGHHYG
jgi:hypothetical protein